NAPIGEEAAGQNFECDINFSVDEEGVTPVVRLIHHGPSSYLEMVDNEAHGSRHSVSPQQHMLMSRFAVTAQPVLLALHPPANAHRTPFVAQIQSHVTTPGGQIDFV
ncbi:hypothetical protein MTO96_047099, partial [Rhipicephalus appendiculatus]